MVSPLNGPSLEATSVLLERVRAGDNSALDILVGRYLIPLRRWASGRLPAWARDLRDTDDIVQDTLIATLRHLLAKSDQRIVGAVQRHHTQDRPECHRRRGS